MGHSVLQVPVPGLEAFVRARTEHYDVDYLCADPAFTHAHVTVLGPFVDELDDRTATRVGDVLEGAAPFDFALERIATFPNGIIHLVPDPEEPFREMTRRFVAAFPGFAPYGGEFPDPAPHLTLDLRAAGVSEASTRTLLGDLVPARCRAERLDLAWYEPGGCRLLHSWPLGLPAVGVGG